MIIRLLYAIGKYPRGTVLEVEPFDHGRWKYNQTGKPEDQYLFCEGSAELADKDVEELRKALKRYDQVAEIAPTLDFDSVSATERAIDDVIEAARKFVPKG